MTPEAVAWHLNGEHGISSEAIFDRLTFGKTTARWYGNYPLDPSDFRRCELLLRAVPEFRTRFSEMAGESPVWAVLVQRWTEIAVVFEDECPGVFDGDAHLTPNRMANRTYALMQSLIEPVRAADLGKQPDDLTRAGT